MQQLWLKETVQTHFFLFLFLFQPIFYVILWPTHSYETTLDKTEAIKGQELIDTGAYLSYPLYTTGVPVSRLFQQQLICIHYLVLFSCLFAWGHISGELYRFFSLSIPVFCLPSISTKGKSTELKSFPAHASERNHNSAVAKTSGAYE